MLVAKVLTAKPLDVTCRGGSWSPLCEWAHRGRKVSGCSAFLIRHPPLYWNTEGWFWYSKLQNAKGWRVHAGHKDLNKDRATPVHVWQGCYDVPVNQLFSMCLNGRSLQSLHWRNQVHIWRVCGCKNPQSVCFWHLGEVCIGAEFQFHGQAVKYPRL